ncbi:acetyl-CoA C-acetyltransferase [Granulicatella adiacens ATCC 49175]|uniref:acetyl-CoA C-acetyltransferase n=1 Tax=Granulicatella adiacens ATCC 49175 TaxID=638301 RepID=C8NGW1_9LACT|nr:acetyl-CoA C-acetyltransferase [Granulicatella adiacens]EEW36938.1 acetyl-CoA C-acetyltransferase [Granulicatella adiacens ATCC 49175]UAK94237.1 acetyl-CoA C-acetyltransferase [Granulicatella adiacens]UWP38525.1 acetyl-CoA C-acetyltransferase [Granulicatella adiacens ATCC 49175]
MNGNDIVIVSATRTAIGKFGGQFATTSAIELGTAVAKSAIQKAKLSPDQIDTVIFGNVLQAGLGQNPARQVGLKAGLLHSSTALTVNEVCGSGLKAIILAAQSLRLGDAKIVLAGGMENMSLAPHLLQQRFAPKNGPVTLVDSLFNDGLTDAYSMDAMGITAENIVEKYGFTREEQDAFAVASQQKAAKAQEEGHFEKEITPVAVFNRKTKSDDFKDSDEFTRANTTLESLSGLKPAFKKDGVVTAGNSSGINDGAACVIMTTREYAKEMNLPILATLKGYAEAGVDPAIMGIGPIPAIEKLVARTRIPLEKVDIFELNEAFAAQSMAVIKDLKIPTEKVNPFGGAIALGHPIGASGTRIVVTLINALEQLDSKLGIASLCVGGGMGVAIAIEREK